LIAAPPSAPREASPLAYGPAPRLAVLRWALAPLGGAAAGALIALALAVTAFVADGGLRLEPTTKVIVGWMLGSGVLVAAAILHRLDFRAERRLHGAGLLAAMGVLTVLTAASIGWSVSPSTSWEETNRTLGYLAAMIAAVALARLAPHSWSSLLQGIAVAAVIVCGWALLTRILPAALSPEETFARVRDPFGYWNAVGGMAALGMPALLWLAARRDGHAAVNALAWPAMTVLLVALMLAYSRGALAALVVGIAFWFVVTPLRLRGAVALGTAVIGAAAPVAWAFSQQALSVDRVTLEVRADAGRELGLLMVLVIAVVLAAGMAATFAAARRPPAPATRRRAGAWLLIGLALVPVIGLMALSQAPGGIGGQVSRNWNQLTDPNAQGPSNGPDRLTQASSVRARYWREALAVHELSPWVGVGAGGYVIARTRVRNPPPLEVRHAHGYLVQTLADLGWAGLAASLLVVVAWVRAAVRTVGLRARDRRLPWDAERVGMATLAAIAVVCAAHSALDFTWFIPGLTVPLMLSAGWLAGALPLGARMAGTRTRPGRAGVVVPADGLGAVAPEARRRGWQRPGRALIAAGALLIAAAVAWSAIQPLRAANASDAAIARVDAGDLVNAAAIARIATERNPLSADALWDLAGIELQRGETVAAQAALERAVRLEPANAESWRRLGRFRLSVAQDPRGAVEAFRAAYYLDPESPGSASDVLEARRALAAERRD
jgi:O-antigen ligase